MIKGGSVMINIRPVSDLRDNFTEIEMKLDEADRAAALSEIRYTEDEVFGRVRNRIHGKLKV